MKTTGILLLLSLVVFFPSISSGQAFQNTTQAKLSNGLKVILLENHKAPIISFQVWYRAGARNERVGKTGLAHVLEHMMFKGTEKVSGENFHRMIDDLGGEENAFTAHDYAGYYETVAADRIGVPLELESDRMKNLILKESDFQTERKVVIEERRTRIEDNPQAFLLEQLDSAAYQSQPYHWPVIGWPEDIERLTIEDVQAFYTTHYNPSNAFLVVTGDFNTKKLLAELEKTFGGIPAGTPVSQFSIQDPPQTGERRVMVQRPTQVGTVCVAYHVPNLRTPDSYVLEVIRAILSEGKSSRLYEHVVHSRALAVEATADYSLVSVDPSLFYLTASVLPEKSMTEVENALYDELERLKKIPVDARELEKAKNQLEATFVFDQDSLFSLGQNLAEYETASDWSAISNYLPSIRSVSAEDIRRVASKYFTPQNRTVGTLIATGPSSQAPAKSTGGAKDRTIRLRSSQGAMELRQ